MYVFWLLNHFWRTFFDILEAMQYSDNLMVWNCELQEGRALPLPGPSIHHYDLHYWYILGCFSIETCLHFHCIWLFFCGVQCQCVLTLLVCIKINSPHLKYFLSSASGQRRSPEQDSIPKTSSVGTRLQIPVQIPIFWDDVEVWDVMSSIVTYWAHVSRAHIMPC